MSMYSDHPKAQEFARQAMEQDFEEGWMTRLPVSKKFLPKPQEPRAADYRPIWSEYGRKASARLKELRSNPTSQ